jgi:hypothetical protein
MALCSITYYKDGRLLQCGKTAQVRVRGYVYYTPPSPEKEFYEYDPVCVDCFSEILHEGPMAGENIPIDGWEVEWIIN